MKIIKGKPTKKAMLDLCEAKDLIINHPDGYVREGRITFCDRPGANANATKVVTFLLQQGVDATLRLADRSKYLTGQIKVIPKVQV